jgi:hypothetical protein
MYCLSTGHQQIGLNLSLEPYAPRLESLRLCTVQNKGIQISKILDALKWRAVDYS